MRNFKVMLIYVNTFFSLARKNELLVSMTFHAFTNQCIEFL